MHLGKQLINPTENRLRLPAQLGVASSMIDTRPNAQLLGEDGRWDSAKVAEQRRFVERSGLKLDVLALDVGSDPDDVCRIRAVTQVLSPAPPNG